MYKENVRLLGAILLFIAFLTMSILGLSTLITKQNVLTIGFIMGIFGLLLIAIAEITDTLKQIEIIEKIIEFFNNKKESFYLIVLLFIIIIIETIYIIV